MNYFRNTVSVLTIGLILTACGKNKAEQMLYDYQAENAKAMNFAIEDLDFDIKQIEKIGVVTAADSVSYYKQQLAEYWVGDPVRAKAIADTISFEYVKGALESAIATQDTMVNLYQEALLEVAGTSSYSLEREYERKRNKASDEWLSLQKTLSKINILEIYFDSFSQKPDSVLSAKYEATYSSLNPLLNNAKQTYNKVFYTNAEQTKFVIAESLQ
jgi:hypothetical protein